MNKLKLFIFGFIFVAAIMLLGKNTVQAACGLATENGRATSNVSVPQAGSYKLWFRIKPKDTTNNSAYVQIDNGTCFKVGDNPALAAGSWAWVNYGQTGSTQTPIVYTFTAGNHSLAVIGTEPGVQIDRNILVSSSDACTPSNQRGTGTEPGDNCLTTSSTPTTPNGTGNTGGGTIVGNTKSGAPIRAVSDKSTVSGDVVLNAAIVNDASVEKVEYYVNSKLVYTSTEMPFHFDTSVLPDGTYGITEKVYYKDGHTEEKTSTLTITNHAGQAANSAKSKKSHLLLFIGIFIILLGAVAALVWFNPTVHAWVAARLSRITGRAIRF